MKAEYYLNGQEGKVVVLFGVETKEGKYIFPKWEQERGKYLYNGKITNQNLREVFDNEVVIEFDKQKGVSFEKASERGKELSKKLQEHLINQKVNFYVTDHNGISPHIRFRVLGLENLPKEYALGYKINAVISLLEQIGFKNGEDEFCKLDSGLITKQHALIPIEYQPHWKEKYNGAIERVIFEKKDGTTINVIPEKVEEILQQKQKESNYENEIILENLTLEDVDLTKLISFWKKYYLVGQRNTLIMALGGMLRKKGFSQETANKLLKQLLQNGEKEEITERLKEFSYSFDQKKSFDQIGVYTHFKTLFPLNENKRKKAYADFRSCFQIDPTPKTEIEAKKKVFELLSHKKKQYSSLGMGVHNGVLYYGTVLQEGKKNYNAVITSDKNIYVEWSEDKNEIRDIFGLNYRFDFFDDVLDFSFSNEEIRKFLSDELNPENYNTQRLYDELKAINKKYVYHNNSSVHSFVACDIMATYVYQIFESLGRTHFEADFESGKSTQTKIYKLSFNPITSGSLTPASFERVIESTSGTIIIDNFDHCSDELKHLILQDIEIYYKKNSKAVRSIGKNFKPIALNGYSPLIINNILGLPEVASSRCNQIKMLKTNDPSIAKLSKALKMDSKQFQIIRDKLYIWGLLYWKDVQKSYNNLEVKDLKNRDLEISEAVLSVASLVGNEVYNEVYDLLFQIYQQRKIVDLSNDWEYMIWKYLDRDLKENEKDYRVQDITQALLLEFLPDADKVTTFDKNKKKLQFSHYAGKVLGNANLFLKHKSSGYVKYKINREDLNKIIDVKGYDFQNKHNATNTTNTTNNPNTTNTTIEDPNYLNVTIEKVRPQN